MTDDTFPRRIKLEENTAEELLIREAVQAVEKLGAHPLLTDVVVKLGEAREKLADWVDEGRPGGNAT